ncbi:hypothetical protein GCM10009634_44830 [Saccharothrix xinjiangensis]
MDPFGLAGGGDECGVGIKHGAPAKLVTGDRTTLVTPIRWQLDEFRLVALHEGHNNAGRTQDRCVEGVPVGVVVLLVAVVTASVPVLVLVIALRGSLPSERPAIIRALTGFIRAIRKPGASDRSLGSTRDP